MRWRHWYHPFAMGVLIGSGGMWALLDLDPAHAMRGVLVLLPIQIGMLIWDVIVTTRFHRQLREHNEFIADQMMQAQAQQRLEDPGQLGLRRN